MVIIVTSLFLWFFYPLFPNFPTGNHYPFIHSSDASILEASAILQATKGVFSLGTPAGRTVCPAGSICSYSIMQDEGQFCLYLLILHLVRSEFSQAASLLGKGRKQSCTFAVWSCVLVTTINLLGRSWVNSLYLLNYSIFSGGYANFFHLAYRQHNLEINS